MQVIAFFALLLIMSCSPKPAVSFDIPPPNPDAPLAFMGDGNMSPEMRREYAAALQKSGFYNFAVDSISEEQIEAAVEIRLNYEEPGKNVYILKAELIKTNSVWLSTTLIEEGKDKKARRAALMERFLAEVKRRVSE